MSELEKVIVTLAQKELDRMNEPLEVYAARIHIEHSDPEIKRQQETELPRNAQISTRLWARQSITLLCYDLVEQAGNSMSKEARDALSSILYEAADIVI